MVEWPDIKKREVAVVIDESHKWSKEFQLAYGRLHDLRVLLPPGIPYMACTATATKSIHQEVQFVLHLTVLTYFTKSNHIHLLTTILSMFLMI